MQNLLEAPAGEAAQAAALRTALEAGSEAASSNLLTALEASESKAARSEDTLKSHHSKHFAKNCAGEVNEVRLIKNWSCRTAQSPAATLQQEAQRRERIGESA